ncbi:MAG: DNA polymerase III subunit gamma/tau [Clostridia bacterium]|nr:DNA polymerase III subunit gamma/tau [Clostridia bacterium]
MAYQALYRQWRPVGFSGMVGQETVIGTLRNQVTSGRIAHAYLFCGSRGTGKTSAAKILARAINCERPVDGDACGECPSCQRLLKDESLDVVEIDAASNNGVDEVRELRENVKYPPQYGHYKVYIIDEVHMLSPAAFNALLKTLEEPPAHVVFILATTDPQRLPATILSRCQRFDFGRIPAAQIAGRLREAADGEGAEATDEALMMIARAAEGGMRDALSLLDLCIGAGKAVTAELVREALGTSGSDFLFDFTRALEAGDAAALFARIDEVMRAGRDPAVFARELCQHLRSLLIAKACPDEAADLLEVGDETARRCLEQAEGFTELRLIRMLEIFMAVDGSLRGASSPRIVLENAALRACLRTQETDTAALQERLGEMELQLNRLKSQLASGAFVPAAPSSASADVPSPEPAEAPAAQKPADKPKKAVSSDVWKELLNRLKTADTLAFACLTKGRLASCAGGVYRWVCNPESAFLAGQVSKPEKVKLIGDLLTEISGAPARVEILQQEPPAETKAGSEDTIEQLRATFGAENVMVQ